MADERDQHVTLRYARGYEFVAEFNERRGYPLVLFDEPPPLGEGRAPNAAAMLGAAVGNCLAASFVFCLRKVHLDLDDLTVRVTTHVARNDKGRFRVTGIDVTMAPELRDQDRARIERCERLFEDFCVVTESVRHGIPVNVTVDAPVAVPDGGELS